MSSRTAFEGLIKKEFLSKGILLHCRRECKLVQSLWKTLWKILKKLKIELPYDPAIPLLGVLLLLLLLSRFIRVQLCATP